MGNPEEMEYTERIPGKISHCSAGSNGMLIERLKDTVNFKPGAGNRPAPLNK